MAIHSVEGMDREPESSPNTTKSDKPTLGYVLVPPAQPPGLNTGIASVVFSLAAPLCWYVTIPFSLLAVLLTRSGPSSGRLAWVVPAVVWSLPCTCGFVALVLGISSMVLARGRSPGGHHTRAWFMGMSGLAVVALEVSIGLWVLITRPYLFLF